jgi:hypothetical protein
MSDRIYWIGSNPTHCQVNGTPLGDVMYDANVPGIGWGNIGHDAFVSYGCSLGLGRGQKYERQPDGRWLKVAG